MDASCVQKREGTWRLDFCSHTEPNINPIPIGVGRSVTRDANHMQPNGLSPGSALYPCPPPIAAVTCDINFRRAIIDCASLPTQSPPPPSKSSRRRKKRRNARINCKACQCCQLRAPQCAVIRRHAWCKARHTPSHNGSTCNSTNSAGDARCACTHARTGAVPAGTHASHSASNAGLWAAMSGMYIVAMSMWRLLLPTRERERSI